MVTYEQDRFKRAISAFIRELFPNLSYLGFYEYQVYSFDETNQLVELQRLDSSLPDLPPIPLRLPGIRLKMNAGASLMVGFEGGNPSKPYIAFYDKLGGGGFVPDHVTIDAGSQIKLGNVAIEGVARLNDTTSGGALVVGTAGPSVTLGYLPPGGILIPLLSATGTAVTAGATPLSGIINSCSSKVQSE